MGNHLVNLVGVVSGSSEWVRSTRLLRGSGLSFEGVVLGVGLQLEQGKRWLQRSAGVSLMFLGAGRGGNGNGRQLRVSLWSDVVQVRTARRRQGTAKGYELCGSGHESTGLGYVGKRRTSL